MVDCMKFLESKTYLQNHIEITHNLPLGLGCRWFWNIQENDDPEEYWSTAAGFGAFAEKVLLFDYWIVALGIISEAPSVMILFSILKLFYLFSDMEFCQDPFPWF